MWRNHFRPVPSFVGWRRFGGIGEEKELGAIENELSGLRQRIAALETRRLALAKIIEETKLAARYRGMLGLAPVNTYIVIGAAVQDTVYYQTVYYRTSSGVYGSFPNPNGTDSMPTADQLAEKGLNDAKYMGFVNTRYSDLPQKVVWKWCADSEISDFQQCAQFKDLDAETSKQIETSYQTAVANNVPKWYLYINTPTGPKHITGHTQLFPITVDTLAPMAIQTATYRIANGPPILDTSRQRHLIRSII